MLKAWFPWFSEWCPTSRRCPLSALGLPVGFGWDGTSVVGELWGAASVQDGHGCPAVLRHSSKSMWLRRNI